MKTLIRNCALCLALASALMCGAQNRAASSAITAVVLPFENASKAPGLQWIGESFPEVLSERMAKPWLYTVSRPDRVYAFDRVGVPTGLTLSRATLFRIAEQMDVDYAIFGRFNFDGQTFTATAQLLDVKHLRLLKEETESGPLLNILAIEGGLAWDLLHQLRPDFDTSRQAFMAEVPLVRLDAFENYVRGVLARGRQEKVRYLKEALRLNPAYTQAMMELGKSYYNAEDYEQAANWFARIPKSNKLARQANFYLGIAAYQLGDNDRAESGFSFVASQYPLPEIYNNLAAIGVRRGSAAAVEQLQRAIQLDPQDADYRFNLALALYRTADYGGAARQLRESLKLRSKDAEAQALLDSLMANGTKAQAPAPAAKVPPPRLKTNYDESPFQQLALEIQNTNEVRLAKMDVPSHAAFHIDHGREMLKQGFAVEAERDFREASELDPSNPAAQAGLAEALEKTDSAGARSAAEAALRLGESVPALLVLARLDLRENHSESAMERVNRVLILDPQERSALALKQSMLAKQNTTQKLPTKGNAP